MIQLRANGEPAPTKNVNITLSQDGADVDILVNGHLVAFFQVQDGKVTLELDSELNYSDELSELLNLTADGFLVANM
jgi:hypothetical protein